MNFKAVLFDLDGTLLDTLEDIADSANVVLKRLGYPEHDYATYKYLVGEGIEKLVRRALPEHKREDAFVKQCVDAMRKEYAQRWAAKTKPYEGVAELLDHLQDKGIRLAVLSNKPDDFTKIMVNDLLPHWRFDLVRGASNSIPKKPDPAPARQIADDLGIAPAMFVFVGDTNIDISTAVRADMFPAGALWGFRTAQELLAAGARVLLETPKDLLSLF